MTTQPTAEQRDRIVELKLQRVAVKKIAAELALPVDAVQECWLQHLTASVSVRVGSDGAARSEALERLEQIATDARHGAIVARSKGDHAAARGYLELERRTIDSIAQLVTEIEATGRTTERSALDELAERRAERLAAAGIPQPPRRQARQRRTGSD